MNKEQYTENKDLNATFGKPKLCAVCKSDKDVEFLTITDCNLCGKCQDELTDGFEQSMTMDREDYPEL